MDKHLKQFAIITGLAVAVLWTTAGYVQAQETSKQPSFNKEEMKEKWEAKREELRKELGITPEQAEQLKAQKASHREGMKGLFEQIKAKREALAKELQKEEIDLNAVHKVHNELKALNAQKEDKRLEGILATREILTPEQFSNMMKRMSEFKDKRGLKWGEFKGSHDGDRYKKSGVPAETGAE